MWKILGTLTLMLATGFIALFVTIFLLMALGTQRYDNYEYYGKYPALYLGPCWNWFLGPWNPRLVSAHESNSKAVVAYLR